MLALTQELSVIRHTPHLGPAIKRLRDAAGLRQKELADRAGIHTNTLLKIEKAKSEPDPETIEAIARALGVTVALIEEEAARGPRPRIVRESRAEYEPLAPARIPVDLTDHPLRSDLEAILGWMPRGLTTEWGQEPDLAAAVLDIYAHGLREGWSADRLEYVHRILQRLNELERNK